MSAKRKFDSLNVNAFANSKPKEKEGLDIAELRTIRCDVPLDAYRNLTKLAADQEPFVKVNQYATNILIEHATKTKGKKG
jgi:hypothetical protein